MERVELGRVCLLILDTVPGNVLRGEILTFFSHRFPSPFFFFSFSLFTTTVFFLFLLVSQGWHYNDAFSRNFNGGVIYRRETRINHDGRAKSSRKIYSCDKRSKFNALRKISLWEDISLYEDIERMYEVSNATKL